jgi:hypothetical protein
MEHPYLFFVKIFEAIGLGHFAHTYPHVVYSWVLMAILIICGAIATKTISMIPGKAQNLFEVIVSGIEEFMVETAGEEARWLFPLAATLFLYIFIGNLIGIIPGFLPPTANLNTTGSCALRGGGVHPYHRCQISWRRLHQTFSGAGLVDGTTDFYHRNHRTPGADPVSLISSVRKHDGTRDCPGHSLRSGRCIFCAFADHGPGDFRGLRAGIRFLSAVRHILFRGHGTRPLMGKRLSGSPSVRRRGRDPYRRVEFSSIGLG